MIFLRFSDSIPSLVDLLLSLFDVASDSFIRVSIPVVIEYIKSCFSYPNVLLELVRLKVI